MLGAGQCTDGRNLRLDCRSQRDVSKVSQGLPSRYSTDCRMRTTQSQMIMRAPGTMGESLYGFKQQITVAAAIFTPRRQKLVWALTAELSIDCMYER